MPTIRTINKKPLLYDVNYNVTLQLLLFVTRANKHKTDALRMDGET